MPEQWQLTLDVIKSRAQTLVVANNGLKEEYRQLSQQAQRLQQSIEEQQRKNEETQRLLEQRHGRTDQQSKIDEYQQGIRMKNQQVRELNEQLEKLNKTKKDLALKIQQLKHTISDIALQRQQKARGDQGSPKNIQLQNDAEITAWRGRLENEDRQEVLLENELQSLKTGDQTQSRNVASINEENKKLEARLEDLLLKKTQGAKQSLAAQANSQSYEQLKLRKEKLESDISAYESRLDKLREYSLTALPWPVRKKKLVHEMVQADARNNQMRGKINVLREDIDVLRDQVAKLEHRLDFAKEPER